MKTLIKSSSAALPGELTLTRARYARYFGQSAVDRWLYRFCACLPWAARHVPVIGWRVFHWTRAREHLRHGCLNPAVVLDPSRGLVPVFTDLTAQGERPAPVVKVLRERLELIPAERVTKGARFAAAALYSRTEASLAQGRWADFFPIVVDCLVGDAEACERATGRIGRLAWKALEIGLLKANHHGREGLYPVDVPDEIVRDAY